MEFLLLISLACPNGQELITVGDTTFCQPTTPLTFEVKSQDDRGSGRLKSKRDQFPDRRCAPAPNGGVQCT